MSKIEIELEDLKRVFFLLEDINHLFHQPMYFNDSDMVEAFADRNFDEIGELYYKVIWNLLPAEVQEEIENR